jgi:hypothetical protein
MQALGAYSLRPAKNLDAGGIWVLISSVLLDNGIIADLATPDHDLANVEVNYEEAGVMSKRLK